MLCEIGAFRDVLDFHGCNISLPMAFGVSGSLGFAYANGKSKRPLAPDMAVRYPVVMPFTPNPLWNAGRIANMHRRSGRCADSRGLLETIRFAIDDGNPVLVEVERVAWFSLTKMPFMSRDDAGETRRIGGHVVAVFGYDTDRETFIIMEIMLNRAIEVDIDAFLAACDIHDGDFPPENEWSVLYPPLQFPSIEEMALSGLELSERWMNQPLVLDDGLLFGRDGFVPFARNFLADLDACSQEIRRRALLVSLNFAELMGPKSGFLRSYFTEFLEEAAPYLPPKAAHDTRDAYQEARKQWLRFVESTLSILRTGGEKGRDPERHAEFREILEGIASAELEAADRLAALLQEMGK